MRAVAPVLLAAALTAACACSAFAVVYVTHLAREAHARIGADRRAIEALDAGWSRLQIERATVADYARVERTARTALDMRLPGPEDSVLIVRRPGAGTP